MKKLISTELTHANIVQVIHLLGETPSQLDELFGRLDSAEVGEPPAPGERSPVEVLAHLIHCEARSSEAIYLALLIDEPLFPDVHPERQWGKLLRYDLLDVSELLIYFKLRRLVLLRVLQSLTDRQWSRAICEAGKKRKESVYWRARSLALHELEHLSDLKDRLAVR
jgi:hypothetical protein